jgi:hypothetical protein
VTAIGSRISEARTIGIVADRWHETTPPRHATTPTVTPGR